MLLSFNSCETRKCVNVSIADDGLDETDEFFTFNLTRTSNVHSGIEIGPVHGQVHIHGGDGEFIIYSCLDIVQRQW